jgi:hypothetical protein
MGGRVDVEIHISLTPALIGGEWALPAGLPPGEEAPQYPLERLSGPQSRCGQYGDVTILEPTGTRSLPLDYPARSQSLYRPRYRSLIKITRLLYRRNR